MSSGIIIGVNGALNPTLTDMAVSVEVTQLIDQPTGYKIRFEVDVCDGDIARRLYEQTDPGTVLTVIAADAFGTLSCLVKGAVVTQNASIQHGGAGSWVEVEGQDGCAELDKKHSIRQWTDVTDADVVRAIVSNDHIADVEETPGSAHTEEGRTLIQRESDLTLVRRLAQRNGFHFWIDSDILGVTTARFRPRTLLGIPSVKFVINQEDNNIDTLQVTVQSQRPAVATGSQIDPRTGEVFGGETTDAGQDTLGADSLANIGGPQPHTAHLAPPTEDAAALAARQQALLREASWFISASCVTSVRRLTKIVQVHYLVEVIGAGSRHSGRYYVTGVTHTLDATNHRMSVQLARNAWGN